MKYAILETNGQLSVLPYANQKPPTAQQLQVSAEESGLPLVVISDGRLLEHNLRALGRDRKWLDQRLEERGCYGLEAVFLLLVDQTGSIYLARKDMSV